MSEGMWYKNGTFYNVPTTHVNFFLQNPEILGFSQEEKKQLCKQYNLFENATECLEQSEARTDILMDVLKRGAIRIRFYGGKTSIQCYDHNIKRNYRELQNCIIDGLGKCFGDILTVMDTKGWGKTLNNMGWGEQILDFVASSLHKQNYTYIHSDSRGKVMTRNDENLNIIFSSTDSRMNYKQFIFSCCDRFNINLFGWDQPIISIDKVLKSSSQYNIDNIIHGKHAEYGYVIVSAEMENLSVPENNKRTKELEDEIVKAGYSFKHALGGYTYEGAEGYTKEKSFVIFNYKRGGEIGNFAKLKRFAIDMCKQFEQQSVLIAEPGKVPVYVDKNGNEVSNPDKSSNKVSIIKENPPAYTSFRTSKTELKDGKREERYLPDRYGTMDIAFSSFVQTLKDFGITHLGTVNTTGNGNIYSSARGMIIVA